MRQLQRLILGAALVVPASAPLVAQSRQTQRDAFTLSERVPSGSWIRVRNVNGEIRVRASTSDKVEVSATKTWRRGDPADVRIESKTASDGSILVCAIWTENTVCTEDRYSSNDEINRRRSYDRDRNDVAVEFEIRVPKGVKVGMWSVNGGVTVDGVTNEVRAGTVNGTVEASSTGGPVQASTVNGSVRATMGRWEGDQDLTFSTVNGSVVAEFSGDIDAEIDLSTVNGRFQTDWPVTISGRIDPRRLRATLGKGGRRIRLSTVNGNVELRKR